MKISVIGWILRWILALRYRIRVKGLELCRRQGKGGILFLPNHPAFIDPVILFALLSRRFQPRGLAEEKYFRSRFLLRVSRLARLIMIPDLGIVGKEGRGAIREKLRECAEALRSGDHVLFYPAGTLSATGRESLGGNRGVRMILDAYPEVQIVLVRTRGLWGSSFSQGKGYKGTFGEAFLRHFPQVFLNFVFFMPRRPVEVEFAPCPEDFPRDGGREEINRYLERFYNEFQTPNTYVPYLWHERGGIRHLPEPDACAAVEDPSAVPEEVRQAVLRKLRDYTDRTDIRPSDALGADLGLDSLVVVELNEWLQERFGVQVNSPESLKTVASLYAAAMGEGGRVTPLKPVPANWFVPEDATLIHVDCEDSLLECFLRLAKRNPDWPVIADQTTGVMTNRQVVLAMLALKDGIAAIPGDRIGLMMPACCMGSVLFLAILGAGKVPVMVNWTVGPRNMRHCLKVAGVESVVTARAVLERLKGSGADFAGVEEKMVFLEDMAAGLGLLRKLSAKLKSLFCWRELWNAKTSETAAILFTSGSESLPKAVPILHRCALRNLDSAVRQAEMRQDGIVIGILPLFHSFGLLINVMLPFATNFRAAYHANPLDGQMIARMTAAYKGTMIIGTPSFAANILKHATPEQMKTMWLFLVGAAKCPESVFALVNKVCPDCNVSEGYGITECGPIVSYSRFARRKSGDDVGRALGCHEVAVVDERLRRRVRTDEMGMLLLRGGSIFPGYLNFSGEDPFVEFEGRKWYCTGDLVKLDGEKRIHFCGRRRRFIKLGGEMVSLPAIEDVLLQAYPPPEGRDGPALAVDAVGDECHPAVAVYATIPLELSEVNHRLRQAGMGPIYSVHRIIRVDAIPVLGTGKTDYRTLKLQNA